MNKLPDVAPLDKSAPVESSADFWRPAPKLNCVAPLLIPSPVSPKANEAAGLTDESLASSPAPTRSPEKLPSVSPPTVFGACGSILSAVGAEEALSTVTFVGGVGDAVPRAGENDSSTVWPNSILPFPPNENLATSLACDIPAPCETEPKPNPVDPDVKENPLLALCSAELAGAAETSVLDD